MKVEIKITAEINEYDIDEQLEKGYTKDSILKQLYKGMTIKHDFIYDYEVDSVKEVK
jgi:hypothetical protein